MCKIKRANPSVERDRQLAALVGSLRGYAAPAAPPSNVREQNAWLSTQSLKSLSVLSGNS
jgi:hypothetical protein